MKVYVIYCEGSYEEPLIYTDAEDALDELVHDPERRVVKRDLDVPKCHCEEDKPR